MSEELMRQNLLVLAQTYANAKGWSLSTVSKQIHGNQAFLDKFLKGDVTTNLHTYFRMVNRMRREWPAGTKWPQTSPIPKLGKKVDKTFVDD